MGKRKPSRRLEDLIVVANFAEVWLAKQGHSNHVGINYLEKIQAPTLQSLYGAALGAWTMSSSGRGFLVPSPRSSTAWPKVCRSS